jgi:lysozyme
MEISNNILVSNGTMQATLKVATNIGPTLEMFSPKALELLKHFESLHDGDKKKANLQPQMDPIGIWTVGYGHVLTDSKGRILKGEVDRNKANSHELANLTEVQANRLLMKDLNERYIPPVLKLVNTKDLNSDQIGALVMFHYNCGTHYKNSKGQIVPYTIWENVNKGMRGKELYDYWAKSVTKSGGKVQPGLVRRRKAEAFLFCKNQVNFTPPDTI